MLCLVVPSESAPLADPGQPKWPPASSSATNSDAPAQPDGQGPTQPTDLAAPGPPEWSPEASSTDLAAPGLPNWPPDASSTEPDEHAEQSHTDWLPSTPKFEMRPIDVQLPTRTHLKIQTAQFMLRHARTGNDTVEIVDRALDALIAELERRNVGRRRPPRKHTSAGGRHVPARIRRAVWDRDQGRCTFVGATGDRCGARRCLEFVEIQEGMPGAMVAADGFRLLCRSHHELMRLDPGAPLEDHDRHSLTE